MGQKQVHVIERLSGGGFWRPFWAFTCNLRKAKQRLAGVRMAHPLDSFRLKEYKAK